MRAAYADREDPDGAYTARWGRPGDERDAALAAHAEVLVLARGQTPRDRGSPRRSNPAAEGLWVRPDECPSTAL